MKIITKRKDYVYRPPGQPEPEKKDKCAICKGYIEKEEETTTVKECKHTFHGKCATKLKELGIECPICFIWGGLTFRNIISYDYYKWSIMLAY